MIKVIASDMDGTLLGDNHKVAPETVEAIREAQAAGIRFMIATGRSYNGAMEELKDLVSTAGAETAGMLIQNREQQHPATYVGKGKIEELKNMI